MTDLDDMKRAADFGAHVLRTESGPGGVLESAPDQYQQGWLAAAAFLDTLTDYPMIPLHMWRTQADAKRGGEAQ